jgi:hypothetical protein
VKSHSFRHSGKLGDIIYSLPSVKALGGGRFFVDYRTQYFGKPPLGRSTALMILDLLETQEYIELARLYEGEPISYNLDSFRNQAVPIHLFNLIKNEMDEVAGRLFGSDVKGLRQQMIPRLQVDLPQLHWEIAGLPGQVDSTVPWITGIPKKSVADIVVCRTARHPGKFDWTALRNYANRSVFVGLEDEWRLFCQTYFVIPFYQVQNLLEFARVVAGARLFVGNQSFGLALADAMSIPRVAELWQPSPNRLARSHAHDKLSPEVIRNYIGL